MELKQIKSFIEIVETGSFTAAAQKLFVTQPVLSMQLKELEKELNCQLLMRTSRHMELTEAGKAFYNKAKHMAELEETIKAEITDITDQNTGILRLGLLPSLSSSLIGDALTSFCKENPAVSYELTEANTQTLLHALETGILDIIFVRTPCDLPGEIETATFSSEKIVAAFRNDQYPLSKPGHDILPLQTLRDHPILISKRFQDLFTHACLEECFSPNIKCSTDSMTTNLFWAERGLGIAIIPFSTYQGLHSPILDYRVLDNPIFSISLLMIKRKNSYLSKQAQAFYQHFLTKTTSLFYSS